MFIYVLDRLNIYMKMIHIKSMKTIYATMMFGLLLLPFKWVQFFEWNCIGMVVCFTFYCLMIRQYYSINQKNIEFKDFIFSIIFVFIIIVLYRLFKYTLNFNQISLLWMITLISIVFLGMNERIMIEG